jgi:hypothetical protein
VPDDPISQFVTTAFSYCQLIDDIASQSRRSFLQEVRKTLPLMYYHALHLPEVESSHASNDRDITHEQWQQKYKSIQQLLGKYDLYWEVFDPIKTPTEEPVAASLADDLSDIWRDIKPGTDHWADASPQGREEILWNWHFSFHYH